jgi:hypothetical protein
VEESLHLLPTKITADMNSGLVREPSLEDVTKALSQMPGLDGFPTYFFQYHWALVGPKIGKVVSYFFRYGFFYEELNFTHIALIPKKI